MRSTTPVLVVLLCGISSAIDNFEYSPVLPENQWKVNMVKEITDVQADQLNVENFSRQELEEMIEYLCTS